MCRLKRKKPPNPHPWPQLTAAGLGWPSWAQPSADCSCPQLLNGSWTNKATQAYSKLKYTSRWLFSISLFLFSQLLYFIGQHCMHGHYHQHAVLSNCCTQPPVQGSTARRLQRGIHREQIMRGRGHNRHNHPRLPNCGGDFQFHHPHFQKVGVVHPITK